MGTEHKNSGTLTTRQELLKMQVKILVLRKRATDFGEEVALNNVKYAIGETLKLFKKRKV